jgi:peptidoglycan hydrolase CwlO-like protein
MARVIRRASARTVALTVALALATIVPASAARAQDAAPGPAQPDPQSLAELAGVVAQNQSVLEQLDADIDAATKKLADLQAQIATTEQQLDATRTAMAKLRATIKARAAEFYQRASTPQLVIADVKSVTDLASGTHYAQVAAHTDTIRADALNRLADQLDAHEHELQTAQAQAQRTKDQLENAHAALAAATAKQKKLLAEAGAVPVMGDAELTADQITGWFQSRGARYSLSGGMPIGDLVQVYMEEGKAEHVRPELAFAQSIIETGSFGHALDNNYAGIGACDSCNGEPAFPTPRDGVRGQIQLLRNYADPTSRAANLKNPPSPTIYGNDPVAAARSYDTFFAKGRTPTWNVMGNGNWATDPGYSQKVLTIYFQMVSFAAKRS